MGLFEADGMKRRRARWGIGHQGVKQRLDRCGDLGSRLVKGGLVRFGGLLVAADFTYELKRGSLDVFRCGGRVDVVER